MAKQGRWILKNVRHDKPGVTIPSASLGLQSKTINLGSVTSNKKPDITTEVFTDLGVHLNLNNITKNPAEGSTFVQGGLTYKVHWVLTEKPQPEPEPEPVITYRLRITDAPENCLPYNGVAQFDAILEKYIDGVHDESSDLLVTSESEWSFISGGDYATRNPAGSNKFIITGNNTTDSVQTVGIKVEYNGQSNVQPTTTSVCFNPEEVPVERDIKISTNKIDADCEDNDLYVVTVTATNVDWAVTVAQNAQSWLSVQDITSDSFKVKVLDFDGARRSGTITVYSTTEGTNISRTVTVTQEDCEPAPVVPKLEVSVSNIDALCKNNRTSAVTVTAENTEWTVTKCNTCSWITISNISSNGFSISVSDSTENERTGIVTVVSTTPGVNITREITVSQPDCRETPEPYLRYTTNLEVCETNKYCIDCDDSTTYTVTVESNVEWTAGTSDTWINITDVTDSGFKVSFANNEGDDRSGTITIWTEDRSLSRLDKTLTIKQYECPDIPTQDTITINTADIEVPCETDETYEISVEASTTWTATTDDTWLNITAITGNKIYVTVSNNPDGERTGTITAYTTGEGIMGSDTIDITQFECEIENDIAADADSLMFECPGDSAIIHISTTGDGVTWTATTNDNWIEITNPSSSEITVTVTGENRTRRNKQGTVTITSNISGKDPIEVTIIQKPTMFFYVIPDRLRFNSGGETITVDVQTNYAFSVSVPTTASSWLSATVSQNTGNNTAWTVSFTALANSDTANPRTTVVTFATNYDGECEWGNMPFVTIEQDKAEPYIPPTPDAYFDVLELYGDFPYYAELGGYTHERSFMDDAYYERCSDLTGGNIDGVVYLMPVRACAIQVYYDTNVGIDGLTYEIEHITPANPSQEWLEVVMKPEEYGCLEEYPEMECGWSEVDSRDEPYPGDFILIKTRDNFEGSHLYEDTYTGYVHIKEKATGNVLCSIPVKCIAVDIRDESVKVSATESTRDLEKNLKIGSESSPAVCAAGGFVDVWVYTNDSAYISDYIPGIFIANDNDVNWNKLSFYYPDDTRMPVVPAQDPMGYIDKIYDTTCNDNGLQLLRVYVAPNYSFNDAVTHGFHVRTENAGFEIFDGGNNAQVRIVQDRDHETYRNNYRIVEFYSDDGGITPVVDETVTDISQISGGTCDGSGHSTHPFFKAIYDYGRASSPGTVYTAETMNDNMIIYDEQAGHDILNPNVLEVTNITYQGGSGWIDVNQNYTPLKNQPFEFYIKPNTGYTSGGSSRKASITITYKNCSPQISRTLEITQSYKQVEPATFGVYLWAKNSQGDRIGNDVEATVTPNSNKEFSFEILTSSNAEGYVMPYVGDNPEPQYYGGIQDYVSAITSITYTAQNFDFSTAMSLYQSGGIVFPEIANKGSYTIKTYGQAFDLKLLCKDKNDPQVQRILTIHVNAC